MPGHYGKMKMPRNSSEPQAARHKGGSLNAVGEAQRARKGVARRGTSSKMR